MAESTQRFARIRLGRLRGHPPVYHYKWFPVLERHPDPSVTTVDGYIWVDAIGKIQSMWAEQMEIVTELPG